MPSGRKGQIMPAIETRLNEVREILTSLRADGSIRAFRTLDTETRIWVSSQQGIPAEIVVKPSKLGLHVQSGMCRIYVGNGNYHVAKNHRQPLETAKPALKPLVAGLMAITLAN